MRVIFDTNIFISYLLKSNPDSLICHIVEECFKKTYTLLLPKDVVLEFHKKIAEKPYLKNRITQKDAKELIEILSEFGQKLPAITQEIPRICRDQKDNYLLAYALIGEADYLVTGDKDLLVIQAIENLRIVTPKEFWQRVKVL